LLYVESPLKSSINENNLFKQTAKIKLGRLRKKGHSFLKKQWHLISNKIAIAKIKNYFGVLTYDKKFKI
jgi:hypothetical protein